MRKLLDTTPKLFAREDAIVFARKLQEEDPDWTYTAQHDPNGTGYSRIAIYDEEGEFVAFFTA